MCEESPWYNSQSVSLLTQKPMACKAVILVCMTPWMRNWSLASRVGLDVTVQHMATVLLGNRVCFPAAGIPTSASIDACYIVYLCGMF